MNKGAREFHSERLDRAPLSMVIYDSIQKGRIRLREHGINYAPVNEGVTYNSANKGLYRILPTMDR